MIPVSNSKKIIYLSKKAHTFGLLNDPNQSFKGFAKNRNKCLQKKSNLICFGDLGLYIYTETSKRHSTGREIQKIING